MRIAELLSEGVMAGSDKNMEAKGASVSPIAMGIVGSPGIEGESQQEKQDSPVTIVDADATDPSLPVNWSVARKWCILIVLSLMSLMVYVASLSSDVVKHFQVLIFISQ